MGGHLPLIVNFAPTGMVPTKTTTPYVPVGVSEIVEAVHEAVEIGITVVHLHARDERSGAPTHNPDVYARIIEGVREVAPDLVVCVSLSGRAGGSLEQRCAPLAMKGALKPDMASVTLGSVNFSRDVSLNDPATVRALLGAVDRSGVLPELEVFDLGMANVARYLVRKGVLRPPHYANLILGNPAGAQADLAHAGMLVRDLPPDTYWAMGGIGVAQVTANAFAVAAGGGVRVGVEDSLWYDRGRSRLATNRDLLLRVHRLAEIHERPVMTSREFRRRLGLAGGNGLYGRRG
ncbi:beta-keto acid cleavage family enzyme [Deferrisoma sp.]